MSSSMSAVELLNLGNDDRNIPFANKIWPQIMGFVFGGTAGCFMNYMSRRPVFSGIQKHVLLIGGFTASLMFIQKKRDEYLAENDAVLRHYVELHPEDFEAPSRKLLANVIEKWTPVR